MNFRLIFSLAFFVIFFLKVGESLTPFNHPDSLYYHLWGARLWYDYSWNVIWENLTSYAQAGYFDIIYYCLFFLSQSLVKIQVLGQVLHFFFSLGLGSLFIFWKIERFSWGILGAICLLTISRDSIYFLYAKNDGALALVALVASYAVINRKNPFLITLLLGLMVGIKLSGALVAIPLFFIFAWDYRKKLSYLFKPFLLFIFVITPKLWINYYYTGNLFFPAFLRYFPGEIPSGMLFFFKDYVGISLTWKTFQQLVWDFFLGKIVFLSAIPLFVYNFRLKNHRLNFYYIVGVFAFLLYLALNGGYQATRFYFSSYFIIIFFIFSSLDLWFKQNELNQGKAKLLFLFVLLIILSDSHLEQSGKRALMSSRDFYRLSEEQMINKYIPETSLWKQLPASDDRKLILSDYTTIPYYLPKNYFVHHVGHFKGASFFLDCKESSDIEMLSNYQYVLLRFVGWRENACYSHVLQKGQLIFSWNYYKLYKLF